MCVIPCKMPKKQESQSIPKHVLHQLNEHTPGGFLLFTFNHETGFPEYRMTFDSPAFYLAMSKYLANWSKATENLHVAMAMRDVAQIDMSSDTSEAGPDDESSTPK